MEIRHVNTQEFEELCRGEKPVLVDFWAPWCGPCRMMGPIIEDLAKQVGDKLTVVKVNVDEEQALAVRYGIMSIPSVFLFKGGEAVEKSVGLRPLPAMLEMVQAYL